MTNILNRLLALVILFLLIASLAACNFAKSETGNKEAQEGVLFESAIPASSPIHNNIPKPAPADTQAPMPEPAPQTSGETTEEEPMTEKPAAEEPPVTPTPAQLTSGELEDYFTNSVFIGDSIQEGIAQYIRASRSNGTMLSNAVFVTTTIGITLEDFAKDRTGSDAVYLSYKGAEKPVEDIIREIGAAKVFILMGMNDMARGIDNAVSIDRYSRAIDIILETNPDTEIIVQLNSPKVASDWLPWYCSNENFNNAWINDFVEKLREMCVNKGIKYVDIGTPLKNSEGVLPDEYCSDGYVHINSAGSKIIVQALYAFAKEQIGG